MNLLAGALAPAYAATLTMILLAAALLWWGPRRGASLWFVAFLVAEGLGQMLNAIENHVSQTTASSASTASELEAVQELLAVLDVAVSVLLVSGLFLIPFATIEFLGRAPRWLAPVVLTTTGAVAIWSAVDPALGYTLIEGRLVNVIEPSYFFLVTLPGFGSLGVALLVMARRPVGDLNSPTRRSHLLLGLGLLVYPLHRGAFFVVAYFLDPLTLARGTASERFAFGGELAMAVFLLFASYLALRHLTRSHPERGGLIITAGVGLGSGILRALTDALPGYFYFGVANLALPLLATYALLRHSLFGLDVRLRFAISKSTIAAAFIAVFFVASEAAQQFFGERFESGYLGILAAGALVFVIAPLSRLADRIAEEVVPRMESPAMPAAVVPEREDMYRSAVRLALRDRKLSRSEERELFRLARGLDLPADRAHAILAEVEGADEESA